LLAILVQPIENLRLETLQNHVVGVLDLLVHAGVSHGCPIDMDVVLIAELEEFLPYELCPIVSDDGVGDSESMDNIGEERYDFL
jgi:hypothetical protein